MAEYEPFDRFEYAAQEFPSLAQVESEYRRLGCPPISGDATALRPRDYCDHGPFDACRCQT